MHIILQTIQTTWSVFPFDVFFAAIFYGKISRLITTKKNNGRKKVNKKKPKYGPLRDVNEMAFFGMVNIEHFPNTLYINNLVGD